MGAGLSHRENEGENERRSSDPTGLARTGLATSMKKTLFSWFGDSFEDAPTRHAFLLIVGLCFVLHIAWFALDRKHDDPDTQSYVVPAKNILAGHGFRDEEGFPDTFRTPGYPMVIAGFLASGMGLTGLVVFQHLLGTLLVAALFIWARLMIRDRLIASTASLIAVLYLPSLHEPNLIMAETIFSVVLFAIVVLTYRLATTDKPSSLVALVIGTLAGLNVLLRPIGLWYGFVLAAYFLLFLRRRLFLVGILILSFALPPALWTARNYRQTGIATLTSITGENLLFFRAAGLLVIEDRGFLYGLLAMQLEHDFFLRFRRLQPKLKRAAEERASAVWGKPASRLSHVQKEVYYNELAREIVKTRIMHYPKLFVSGVIQLLVDGLWQIAVQKLDFDYRRAIPGFTFLGLMLLGFAVAGVVWFCGTSPSLGWLLALTLGYFVAVSAGPGGVYRFSVPIAPLYALAAGGGIRWLANRTGIISQIREVWSALSEVPETRGESKRATH